MNYFQLCNSLGAALKKKNTQKQYYNVKYWQIVNITWVFFKTSHTAKNASNHTFFSEIAYV